jgi:hypothetical protein
MRYQRVCRKVCVAVPTEDAAVVVNAVRRKRDRLPAVVDADGTRIDKETNVADRFSRPSLAADRASCHSISLDVKGGALYAALLVVAPKLTYKKLCVKMFLKGNHK